MQTETQSPDTFRLPLATCRYIKAADYFECDSADGAYQLHLMRTHGMSRNTQYWAYEKRLDDLGRRWICTVAEFVVDDFGGLVEVAA